MNTVSLQISFSHWRKPGRVNEPEPLTHLPHQPAPCSWHRVGCVHGMPTVGPQHSQPAWLARSHSHEGSGAKSHVICSTSTTHLAERFTLRELILGITVLFAHWEMKVEGTTTKEELVCARNYAPFKLKIHNTYRKGTQLHKRNVYIYIWL